MLLSIYFFLFSREGPSVHFLERFHSFWKDSGILWLMDWEIFLRNEVHHNFWVEWLFATSYVLFNLDQGCMLVSSMKFWHLRLTISLDCAIPYIKAGFPQGFYSSLRQTLNQVKTKSRD